MIYEFKAGARIPAGVTAHETHEQLDDIRRKHGALTAENVAADVESEPEEHPLRWAFTWDETEAIHKCHVQEAGSLIRAVVVKHITPEHTEPVRAYVVVRGEQEAHRYEHINVVIKQPDLRSQLMEQVEEEFNQAERKRRELLALISVL